MNKAATFAGLMGITVKIDGGYHHVKKGYLVTVETDERKQLTVSFTDLVFTSEEEQAAIFKNLYHLTPQAASLKGQKKGVPQNNFQATMAYHQTSKVASA